MKKWIKELLTRASQFFTRPETKAALVALADYVPRMMPYLDAGMVFIAGATPTTLDDIALAYLHKNFPRLFDRSINSGDELKRYVGDAIASLFADRFLIRNNQARAILELALLGRKVDTGV